MGRPKGMGNNLGTACFYRSFFPFLHPPHTSLNPITVPSFFLYLASCPTFSQQLPNTNGIYSLMPGGREKEQNSGLLIFQPLTPVVTFSTSPLLSATTQSASTLSSPLTTTSLNYLFQTSCSFLATTTLSPDLLTQILLL